MSYFVERKSWLNLVLSIATLTAWAVPLVSAIVSNEARADIIMFDMHLSDPEVRAASTAAKKRGEELIVLPKIDLEARRAAHFYPDKIAALTGKRDAAQDAYDRASEATPPATNEQLEALAQKLDSTTEALATLQNEWSDFADRIPRRIDAKKLLRETLTSMRENHRTLTALIGSGESTGMGFEGNVGGVYRLDLKAVFDEFPDMRDGLQSVFLWGCYSANRDDVVWWRENFPKLVAIYGFEMKAPLAENPASPALLRAELERDPALRTMINPIDIAKTFRALPYVRQVHAVAAVNSVYVGGDIEPFSLSLPPQCEGAEKIMREEYPVFQDCYLGNARCPSPPANTQHSELRTFYSNLQNYGICRAYSSFISALPMLSQVISLVFYTRVRRHFATYYGTEIAAVDAALAQSEFKNLAFPDPLDANLSRQLLNDKVLILEQQVMSEGSSVRENAQLKHLISRAKTMLRKLECVPTSWATEEETVDRAPDTPGC